MLLVSDEASRLSVYGWFLNGPSLPLDVGQTDDTPVHLRRLVALRDRAASTPAAAISPPPV